MLNKIDELKVNNLRLMSMRGEQIHLVSLLFIYSRAEDPDTAAGPGIFDWVDPDPVVCFLLPDPEPNPNKLSEQKQFFPII